MILAIIIGYTVFIFALGLGCGWYVRGAYLTKKKKEE